MLSKYGTDNIIVMLAISVAIAAIAYFFVKSWPSYILYTLAGLLALFTFWFFRDPDRSPSQEYVQAENILIAPSDGKVVEIVEEEENVYLKEKSTRISIFLSPLDVHVNRIPVKGKIEYFKYHPGEFLVAWHPKSSMKNEQTHIGLSSKYGKVFFKQIVGVVARRLAWDINEGDSVDIAQKFGMMKFGSRMDIAVPYGTEINVKVGDRTVAGESKLATLKK